MSKYSLKETNAAYVLLSLQSCEPFCSTWQESSHMNIGLRTRTGSDILTYINHHFHHLGTSLETLCAEIEHYHFVTSPTLRDYLSIEKIKNTIHIFAEKRGMSRINFEAFLDLEDLET